MVHRPYLQMQLHYIYIFRGGGRGGARGAVAPPNMTVVLIVIHLNSQYVTHRFNYLSNCLQELHRNHKLFKKFYELVVKNAYDLQIGEPMLTRFRKAPRRYDDDGSPQFAFNGPRSYYCHKYFEACDLLVEVNNRFFQRDCYLGITVNEANGDSCLQELSDMKESIFKQGRLWGWAREPIEKC